MMRTRSLYGIALAALLVSATASRGEEVPSGWELEWPNTEFSQHEVPFSEIVSGGPPKDGIPSIDDPDFASVSERRAATDPRTPAMSVETDGDARAYPLEILIWHEIVNDTVGGRPVAVTYCPLCNSGVVFERVVAGEATTFGTTGKLRHSDLVMYDRATESWWQQFEGRAIVGARAGDMLERVPARLESFADFAGREREGLVLVPPAERERDYGRNPYAGYDSAPMPFMYRGDYDGPGSPLMRVIVVEGFDEAWSLDFIRRVGRVEVADIVITQTGGQASALDTARIAEGREVGTVHVERLRGGWGERAIYHVPFAFRAFNPDAPLHHVE